MYKIDGFVIFPYKVGLEILFSVMCDAAVVLASGFKTPNEAMTWIKGQR
ncbi:MAG: hypothetical protein WCW84_07840 [Sulfurimonas sp.]